MRTPLALVLAVLSLVAACDKKSSSEAPTSKLGDLSTSLAAAREAFNAHKGEARFLTLLSPT